MQHYIKQALGDHNASYARNEILRNIQYDRYLDPEELNGRKDLLNLLNGALDLKQLKLLPHDRAQLSTIQLPVHYQENARCDRWLQFHDEIFAGDKDKQEKIDFLQEYTGYLLIPDVRQEKAGIFLGPGANGKGTYIAVVEAILGEANFSAVSLENLKNPHYRADLFGKLLNVSTESGAAFLKHTDILKQLISGDTIACDRKYEQPFKFEPHARFLFAMNELPRINDTSYGFFRRLVIIEFNRKFDETSRDPYLREKLLGELDGIFLWALVGLKRLRERGYFIDPPSSKARVARYQLEASSVLQFVEQECILNSEASIQAEDFYKDYVVWAKDNGLQPVSSPKFSDQILTYYRGQITRERRSEGRFYRGVEKSPL